MPFLPFTKEEKLLAQAAAMRGEIPSFETVGRYIATIRKNWAAKPLEKTQGKSRVTKAPPKDESQIDFF